jgi:hypothetical protein
MAKMGEVSHNCRLTLYLITQRKYKENTCFGGSALPNSEGSLFELENKWPKWERFRKIADSRYIPHI